MAPCPAPVQPPEDVRPYPVDWKIGYPGVAQLVAHVIWVREAGVRAALLQNPGKLWDAKADGVLPLSGNWSKTGADPIFDHS